MDTRQRIVVAAASVMLAKGLAKTTTREIARAAECSEGTLYNYFKNKEDLFLAVLWELPSNFVNIVVSLVKRAGSGTVQANLEEVIQAALQFYSQSIPMGASFFADPDLLARHRQLLHQRGAGPHKANLAVAAYLRAEQQLGRVRQDANPEAISYLLLGACYQKAYWTQFVGDSVYNGDDEHFASDISKMLLPTLLSQNNEFI